MVRNDSGCVMPKCRVTAAYAATQWQQSERTKAPPSGLRPRDAVRRVRRGFSSPTASRLRADAGAGFMMSEEHGQETAVVLQPAGGRAMARRR